MTFRPMQISLAAAGVLALVLLASPGAAQTGAAAREPAMSTQVRSTVPASAREGAAPGDEAIHPFRFRASDADLADLRRRIAATRWPTRETVAGRDAGRAAGHHAEARALLGRRSTTGAGSRRG